MGSNGKVSRTLLTPLSYFDRSVRVFRDKTAVVHGDKRYTYRQFGERVNQLASALKASGLSYGDRVAFLCPNIPPMLEAHFGVPLAGGVLVSINTRLSWHEIEYILNHSGSRYLFVDTSLSGAVAPILHNLETVEQVVSIADEEAGESLEGESYETFLKKGAPTPQPVLVRDEDDTIAINYTSGTTGKPKGVMYTHRGAYLNALGESLHTQLTPSSVYLWTLPMFHCNGWCFTWGVTAVGGTHVCLRRFEPETAWHLVQREGVTNFNGAPILMNTLLNHPSRPRRLGKPLTCAVAGAPPSPTLIEHMHEIGAEVVHVYGLTETYGPYTVCEHQASWQDMWHDDRARLEARQGVQYIVADPVRVVNDDMTDVPADGETMGEVVMHGNNVMKGYYNDAESTEAAFRGGWFHSGDLAVMHPDGYIELRDRAKDCIITGGENVSSIEIEQAIYKHDAVMEVAVVGIPHERWGETPKAFVTLKSGQSLTEQELIDFCREQMAHFKCPTAVEFSELPKTSTGKIQKFVLRERAWAGREKLIQG